MVLLVIRYSGYHFRIPSAYYKYSRLLSSPQAYQQLVCQSSLLRTLEGHIFKDYLNYFLDTNYKLASSSDLIYLIGAGGFLGSLLAQSFLDYGKSLLCL